MAEHPDRLRNRARCSSCGARAQRRQGLVPLGWQELPDTNARPMALCPECVRRDLGLIEARLDVDPASGI